MAAEAQPQFRRVNEETEMQYGHEFGSAFNVNARRVLYDKYADPVIGLLDPTDPEGPNWGIELELIRALREAGYTGKENFGDIGCGDGRFVSRVVRTGHAGDITGFNYPGNLFVAAENDFAENPRVNFYESRAEDLRLPDGSRVPDGHFRVVTINNLLYHVEDYEAVLAEAYRTLEPGGILGITTKEDGNQQRLWDFQQDQIAPELMRMSRDGETEADYRGLVAPKSFYSHFDFEVENKILPKGFRHTGIRFRHFGKLLIPDTEDGRRDYLFALFSLKDIYKQSVPGKPEIINPVRSRDMRKAIEVSVMPIFEKEAQENGGCFEDTVEVSVMPIFEEEAQENGGCFEDTVRMGFDLWQKPF